MKKPERSEKIKLLKLLQAGSISRGEFAEKIAGPRVGLVIIFRGNPQTGPFFIGGKEYATRAELDTFLATKRGGRNTYLPEKKRLPDDSPPAMYLPDNGRSLWP